MDCIVYIGQELPEKLAFNSSVPVVHVPLKDGVDDRGKWDLASELVGFCLKRGRVLVACRGGKSRSPMLAVYWLVGNGYDFQRAFDFVKSGVPEFRPEMGLVEMLKP